MIGLGLVVVEKIFRRRRRRRRRPLGVTPKKCRGPQVLLRTPGPKSENTSD